MATTSNSDSTTTSTATKTEGKKPARKKSNVYTKTGDKGTTSLYNMERKPKTDEFFAALGDTDELNARLGMARHYCQVSDNGLDEYLSDIQCRLLDVGSAIATPLDTSTKAQVSRANFSDANVESLEEWIDGLDAKLPPLTNFILPSGGLSSSQLHIARTTCRRAERSVLPLTLSGRVPEVVAIYLNRLSDFFFVAARYAAMKDGCDEDIYKKARAKKKKGGGESSESEDE